MFDQWTLLDLASRQLFENFSDGLLGNPPQDHLLRSGIDHQFFFVNTFCMLSFEILVQHIPMLVLEFFDFLHIVTKLFVHTQFFFKILPLDFADLESVFLFLDGTEISS